MTSERTCDLWVRCTREHLARCARVIVTCDALFWGRVTAVTSSADKKDFVKSLGADDVVVCGDASSFHKLLPAAGKVDMAIDCVGGPTMNGSLRSVKAGGSVIVLGNVENR